MMSYTVKQCSTRSIHRSINYIGVIWASPASAFFGGLHGVGFALAKAISPRNALATFTADRICRFFKDEERLLNMAAIFIIAHAPLASALAACLAHIYGALPARIGAL